MAPRDFFVGLDVLIKSTDFGLPTTNLSTWDEYWHNSLFTLIIGPHAVHDELKELSDPCLTMYFYCFTLANRVRTGTLMSEPLKGFPLQRHTTLDLYVLQIKMFICTITLM